MGKQRNRLWLAVLLGLPGLLVIGMAVFALQLGIDNNNEWGKGRYALLAAGGLLVFAALVVQNHRRVQGFLAQTSALLVHTYDKVNRWPAVCAWRARYHRLMGALRDMGLVKFVSAAVMRVKNTAFMRYFRASKMRMIWLLAFAGAVIVMGIQFKVATGGKHALTFYHNELTEALLQGQIHLLETPDPMLAALDDPYEPSSREGLNVKWDATYYGGKYYLYFGPTPALVGAVMRPFFNNGTSDLALVLMFSLGTFVFSVLLIIAIWQKFFSKLPVWTIIPGIFVMGLANPMVWVLSRPSIYEASILGGQCFLSGGLYFAFTAPDKDKTVVWKLAITGVLWSLAVGARASLAVAIFFLALMICWRIFQQATRERIFRRAAYAILALGIPLFLGAVSLSWYNYARYDSIFETGHRYQLGRDNNKVLYEKGAVINSEYIIPNAYAYLIRPPDWEAAYPYVTAPWVKDTSWPYFIHLPPYFSYTEPVTGLLATTPYAWLSVIPFLAIVGRGVIGQAAARQPRIPGCIEEHRKPVNWMILWIGGAAFCEFGIVAMFFTSAMRYLVDVIPSLIILSTIGFWLVCRALVSRYFLRKVWFLTVSLAALISSAIGVLIEVNR